MVNLTNSKLRTSVCSPWTLVNGEEIFSTCRTNKRLTHRKGGIPVSQQKKPVNSTEKKRTKI